MNAAMKNVTDGSQIGLSGGATGFNNPTTYNNESYETFNKSHSHFFTSRFSEIKPTLALTALPGDVIKLAMKHEVRNLPIQNALMSEITFQQSYFQVPYQAIMPRNWELLLQQPVEGDDVPANAYPNLHVGSLIEKLFDIATGQNTTDIEFYHTTALIYLIMNPDSILANLGYQPTWTVNKKNAKKLERDLKTIISYFINGIDEERTFININGSSSSMQNLNPENKLSIKREIVFKTFNGTYEVTQVQWSETAKNKIITSLNDLSNIIAWETLRVNDKYTCPCITRLAAFKMSIAQFYTNDKIDAIHSAKEWLENQEALLNTYSGGWGTRFYFTMNGKKFEHDILSKAKTDAIINIIAANYEFNTKKDAYAFMFNLFSYDYSLRFNDYFTQSRTRALAVGNITAPIVGQGVSAIDINKTLWTQRFLNAVNRASEDAYQYLKEMFGVEPSRKIPMPYHLATETYKLGQQETETTAGEGTLGDVATALRSEGQRYEFETKVDEFSEIIGIVTYNITSVYKNIIDRTFDVHDRDGMFNPFMQHFGDQAVYTWELDGCATPEVNYEKFGYQTRYAEHKNAISYATGAFKDTLSSWIATDNYARTDYVPVIDSDIIRNQNSCLDEIFERTTGFGYEDYFHFINKFDYNILVNSKQQKSPSLI